MYTVNYQYRDYDSVDGSFEINSLDELPRKFAIEAMSLREGTRQDTLREAIEEKERGGLKKRMIILSDMISIDLLLRLFIDISLLLYPKNHIA